MFFPNLNIKKGEKKNYYFTISNYYNVNLGDNIRKQKKPEIKNNSIVYFNTTTTTTTSSNNTNNNKEVTSFFITKKDPNLFFLFNNFVTTDTTNTTNTDTDIDIDIDTRTNTNTKTNISDILDTLDTLNILNTSIVILRKQNNTQQILYFKWKARKSYKKRVMNLPSTKSRRRYAQKNR